MLKQMDKYILVPMIFLMAAVFLILAVIVYVDGYYIFTSTGNKKWLFDLVVIILFPMLTAWMGSAVKPETDTGDKIAAIAMMAVSQLTGFILFRVLGDIWILWMIVMGTVSIWTMVFSVSPVENNADVERKMRWVFAYLIFWAVMFFLFQENFLGGYGKKESNVLSLYGVLMQCIYFAVMILFAYRITDYLGKKHKMMKSMYLIHQAAYVNLMLRVIFGSMYWLGISPFPVCPPFTGVHGVVMDSMCMGILLQSHCENEDLSMLLEEENASFFSKKLVGEHFLLCK